MQTHKNPSEGEFGALSSQDFSISLFSHNKKRGFLLFINNLAMSGF